MATHSSRMRSWPGILCQSGHQHLPRPLQILPDLLMRHAGAIGGVGFGHLVEVDAAEDEAFGFGKAVNGVAKTAEVFLVDEEFKGVH